MLHPAFETASAGVPVFCRGRIQEERKILAALNIKDPEVHELASELARRTKRSLTEAVKDSLRESLARQRSSQVQSQRVVERVMRVAQRIAASPVLDARTPDEILGYNDIGVPE
jgi:antitoxin VapB